MNAEHGHPARQTLDAELAALAQAAGRLPDSGLAVESKVLAALRISNVLQQVIRALDEDPYPPLLAEVRRQTRFLLALDPAALADEPAAGAGGGDPVARTRRLYEDAWTVYDEATYRHSVDLILARLRANGYDEAFFAGKDCFDGGCGTARFAVAMALLGARRAVGADMGGRSLEFARAMMERLGVRNVELVETDVTDLSAFADGSFDFVVSNGVLHHALETERGIREHFRLVRRGGLFWLYLYGAGGLYWHVYDALKQTLAAVDSDRARRILLDLDLRQGAIYTYLDNVLAPVRKYYYADDVVALLRQEGELEYGLLRGTAAYDDAVLQRQSRWGREILGEQGEVRLWIKKA